MSTISTSDWIAVGLLIALGLIVFVALFVDLRYFGLNNRSDDDRPYDHEYDDPGWR